MPLCRLLLLCFVALFSGPARAADDLSPYIFVGFGLSFPADGTFSDENCRSAAPAALFGCGSGADGKPIGAYGDFGIGPLLEGGVGLSLGDWARTEVLIGFRPDLDFEGDANFRNVPLGRQPVSAGVSNISALVGGQVYPAALMGISGLPVHPFLGGYVGLSRTHIEKMVYRFPSISAESVTITRPGDSNDFAWALQAGFDVRLSDELTLSLAYRYLHLGQVRTDAGEILVVRPARQLTIPVGETRSRLRTQELSLSVRLRF